LECTRLKAQTIKAVVSTDRFFNHFRQRATLRNKGLSMTKDDAEKLSILMMQINSMMNDSVAFVRDNDKDEIFDGYARTAGKIMGSLFLDIEEKLWNKYPELRPEQMDGDYKVDPKIFQPRFYEWK